MPATRRKSKRTLLSQAFRRVFSVGKRFTPAAQRLRTHLVDLDPSTVNDRERAEIEDLLVAWLAASSAERISRLGRTVSAWGDRGAPRQTALRTRPRWAEHRFRVSLPGEPPVYVAEPYRLGPEDLQDLLDLARDGWAVAVSGASQHSPGRTLRISLQRAPGTSQVSDSKKGGAL